MAAQSIRVNVGVLEKPDDDGLGAGADPQPAAGHGRRRLDDSEFKAPLQRLSSVTAELQESVMKTRMQPVGNAWSKLPRIIRDLANELGKKIDLRMTGAETELDRQVLEMIKDPLTHMVRNSADHGLEGPKSAARPASPKPARSTCAPITRAAISSSRSPMTGAAWNIERIKAKALQNGSRDRGRAGRDARRAGPAIHLRGRILDRGEGHECSGRGVGMDVVRTNIDNIGGTVSLKSPMARLDLHDQDPAHARHRLGADRRAGGQRFALPQISWSSLSTPPSVRAPDRNTSTPRRCCVCARRLLPLVYLSDVLGLPHASGGESGEEFIVVTKVRSQIFGIVVEGRPTTPEEIVVKPLSTLCCATSRSSPVRPSWAMAASS